MMKGANSCGSLALSSFCTCLCKQWDKLIKWHFANTCRSLHSGMNCIVKVATSLTRDNLGSGHSRSFWNSDLRNLSVIPHFEGTRDWGAHSSIPWALRPSHSTCCVAHSSSEVQTDWRCSLRTQLGLHPTYFAVLTACSLEQMFTSNMSWDFIQLRCSTCRKLT